MIRDDVDKISATLTASAAWNNVSNIMSVFGADSDEAWSYIEQLMPNLVIAGSSSACFKSVQQGEYVVGLTYEDDVFLPTVIINDGRLLTDQLRRAGRDEAWLQKQLDQNGVSSPHQVFLLSVDERGETVCIVKEDAK